MYYMVEECDIVSTHAKASIGFMFDAPWLLGGAKTT